MPLFFDYFLFLLLPLLLFLLPLGVSFVVLREQIANSRPLIIIFLLF
jgi:hypothetical protein